MQRPVDQAAQQQQPLRRNEENVHVQLEQEVQLPLVHEMGVAMDGPIRPANAVQLPLAPEMEDAMDEPIRPANAVLFPLVHEMDEPIRPANAVQLPLAQEMGVAIQPANAAGPIQPENAVQVPLAQEIEDAMNEPIHWIQGYDLHDAEEQQQEIEDGDNIDGGEELTIANATAQIAQDLQFARNLQSEFDAENVPVRVSPVIRRRTRVKRGASYRSAGLNYVDLQCCICNRKKRVQDLPLSASDGYICGASDCMPENGNKRKQWTKNGDRNKPAACFEYFVSF